MVVCPIKLYHRRTFSCFLFVTHVLYLNINIIRNDGLTAFIMHRAVCLWHTKQLTNRSVLCIIHCDDLQGACRKDFFVDSCDSSDSDNPNLFGIRRSIGMTSILAGLCFFVPKFLRASLPAV